MRVAFLVELVGAPDGRLVDPAFDPVRGGRHDLRTSVRRSRSARQSAELALRAGPAVDQLEHRLELAFGPQLARLRPESLDQAPGRARAPETLACCGRSISSPPSP